MTVCHPPSASLLSQLRYTFLPVKGGSVLHDVLIPLLPQSFLIFLLFYLPQGLTAFFLQALIGSGHLGFNDHGLTPDAGIFQDNIRSSVP